MHTLPPPPHPRLDIIDRDGDGVAMFVFEMGRIFIFSKLHLEDEKSDYKNYLYVIHNSCAVDVYN